MVAVLVACAAPFAFPRVSVAAPGLSHPVVSLPTLPGRCSDARLTAPVRAKVPWCTIRAAILAAPPGGTVQLRAGTYPYQQLHGLGLRQRYVTIEPAGYRGRNPANVTIQGISTANVSHLRFRGLRLVGSDVKGFRPAARIYLNSHNIQLDDVDMVGEGVYVQGASYVRIAHSTISSLARNCAIHQIGDGGGIFVQRSTNVSIVRNRIEGAVQDALNFGGVPYLLVRGNDLSNAPFRMCGDHTDLVQIEGSGKGPMTFVNNVFHDGGQFIMRNATGLTFAGNLILRVHNWMHLVATPGARVVNNVWWRGNRGCPACGSLLIRDEGPKGFDYAYHMTGTLIKRNVMRVFARGGVPPGEYREAYNIIYGSRAGNTGVESRHTQVIGHEQPARHGGHRRHARSRSPLRLGRRGTIIVRHLLRHLQGQRAQPQIIRVVARIERRWGSPRRHRARHHGRR